MAALRSQMLTEEKWGALRAKWRLQIRVAIPVTCSCGADFLAALAELLAALPLGHNPRLRAPF